MPRIIDIIQRLLPRGSSLLDENNWANAPFWPPDTFAVAATLVNLSDCYAKPKYSIAGSPGYIFTKHFHSELQHNGLLWSKAPLSITDVPQLAKKSWKCLLAHQTDKVANTPQELGDKPEPPWWDAAITLLCLADVASAGVGFYNPLKPTQLGHLVYKLISRTEQERKKRPWLPDLRLTLCWMVDQKEAVVQPKSRTPQVGCTLRSLTHNLSLLPPVGEITTSWRYGPYRRIPTRKSRRIPTRKILGGPTHEEPLNLLLVPFPFHLDSTSFIPKAEIDSPSGQFFDIRQDWLNLKGRRITPNEFSKFLLGLIKAARKETRRVHGIILPEAALEEGFARQVAKFLAKRSSLELFVTGTTRVSRHRQSLPVNEVQSYLFYKKKVFNHWAQSKHHRWKLDAGQIRRYHLGDALDHRKLWWEHIDLKSRECVFYVFRHGASMASLVCEDLARIDPVQTVLRAVGPNLLIVLLMDGPQLERRWPGRYATVLADDPGSAVMTLTSLGMVRRSRMPGEHERREIALWKEPGGEAKELSLPEGCHALLATLSHSWETNYTLDGRPDGPIGDGGTMHLSLTGIRGVAHPNPQQWIDDNRHVW